VNLTLALPSTLREVSIDGELFVLVRRSALDALYPNGAAGDRITRSPAARTASVKVSRPAPKKLKAPSPKPAARPAAAPALEADKPVMGALRAAVLEAITQNPGRTSLELHEILSAKFPASSSGSTYTAIKSWVARGEVLGRPTEAGPKGWFPARSVRKPAGGPALHPNAPGMHAAPSGSAEARGAA
jgi:hypothetical protein